MLKKELEMIHAYYYGISKMRIIWKDELEVMDKKGEIKRIYEIVYNEFNEKWYYIKDKKENGYIVKNRIGAAYGANIMEKYKNTYSFCRLGTDLIKIIDDGIFPIVVKVNKENFYNYYDKERNINNFFFNSYYCEEDRRYSAVKSYRNKNEFQRFDNELEAIKWCRSFKYSTSNIADKRLIETVYEDIN